MVSDQPAATGNVGQLMPTGIEVEHLTERYGDNVTVEDISFAVDELTQGLDRRPAASSGS